MVQLPLGLSTFNAFWMIAATYVGWAPPNASDNARKFLSKFSSSSTNIL